MRETLAMCGFAAVPGLMLIVHSKGLAHSIRVMGNCFYAAAHALEEFRRDFKRLNAESRRIRQ